MFDGYHESERALTLTFLIPTNWTEYKDTLLVATSDGRAVTIIDGVALLTGSD
jgi:hypothetical protein